jgi:hypothetical protein
LINNEINRDIFDSFLKIENFIVNEIKMAIVDEENLANYEIIPDLELLRNTTYESNSENLTSPVRRPSTYRYKAKVVN